jgi:membrane-associated phospholipid phosphatase
MRFISGVFHPLLLASYFLLVLNFYHPSFFSPVDQSQIPRLILAAFVTTFVIPALSILIMKFTSRISSLSLSTREERLLPFISIFLFYAATSYLFTSKLGMKPPLSSMMIATTALIGLLLVITNWEKISIHAASSWFFAGLMSGVFISFPGENIIYPVIGSTVMAGLVSSSRLYLQRHTEKEVWTGAGIGFVIGFFTVLIFG